jgi:hypothetical protein
MSLSFRNRITGTLLAAAWLLLMTPAVRAQQLSFVPGAQATIEYDDNRLLSKNHPRSGEWYEALLYGDLTRETVRSMFEIRPEVNLQESSYRGLNRFEAHLDARGEYRTQRTLYKGTASYRREDAYNAEYGYAQFNPLNPGQPDTVGTGAVVTGVTRQTWTAGPNITHSFTERFSGELDGNFTSVRYSTQVPQTLVSFDSPYMELDALWALSQRSTLGVGPFYTRYDPTNGREEGALISQSYGAVVSYRYRTAQTSNYTLDIKAGRDEQNQFDGTRTSATAWGVEWKGVQQWLTSRVQYSIGRFLEPSSVGGEIGLYQFRVQYSKAFNYRWSGLVAVRVTRSSTIGVSGTNRDRSYGEASMQYSLTRRLNLQGGFRFGWQRLAPDAPSVHNDAVFITVGFHGLDPRR